MFLLNRLGFKFSLFFLIFISVFCGIVPLTQASQFKVALLTPGAISDAGWNALAYDGLKAIEKELAAKVSHVESKTPAQWEEHFRFFASNGYDLIFGHGFEYQDAAKTVGGEFSDTIFITTSGNTVEKNVASVVFELEEATYLLGIIAASMSKTGKIGAIGGMNIPPINSTFHAFIQGAKSVNSKIQISKSYVGNWEDVGKAKELALSQIAEGVDLIFHNADAAGVGVFEAVSNSRKEGKSVFAFGSNRNQNDVAPDAVLASAVIDTSAFVRIAKIVKEGKFEAKVMMTGMAQNEAIKLVYNPNLKSYVPKSVQENVEKVRQQIIAGSFKAPRPQFLEN